MKTQVKINYYKDYRSNIQIGGIDKNGETYIFYIDCDVAGLTNYNGNRRKKAYRYLRDRNPELRLICTYDYND